jgi:transcriptional regulator with XRE-family HTH domain
MEITEVFGKNLRRIREARSMSAELLGQKAGVTGKHIYDVEKKIKKPSFDLVVSVARALNVKIADLFEDGEEQITPLYMPVSKTLQKLMAIPDKVYDFAQDEAIDDEVWEIIEDIMEGAIEDRKLLKLPDLNKG